MTPDGLDTAWSGLDRTEQWHRARALDMLCGDLGVVVGVAIDHRDSLRAELDRVARTGDDAAIADLKAQITAALAPLATVVLLDAELGAPAAVVAGALPGATALVLPLESAGYGEVASVETTELAPEWSPTAARRAGAAACKLLLPFRADIEAQALRQASVAAACAKACRESGMVLILEPIVYRRPEETLSPERFGELVIAGAERLAETDPGMLKLQYPGSIETCRALDRASGAATPWVLLGGGVDAQTLVAQVEDACEAGASGCIVGRSLWRSAVAAGSDEERQRALHETGVSLLHELRRVCIQRGQPWRVRVSGGPLGASRT